MIPNTVYYLISPGRHTSPVPPDQTFPTEDLNTFLLAASEDDAAAGNAIYIPEGLNSGVQIEMFQYIFDVIPTPYKYMITNADPATNEFTLESAHVFEVQDNGYIVVTLDTDAKEFTLKPQNACKVRYVLIACAILVKFIR